MKKTKGFFGEFKEFIMRGNVLDLAVGVIIGGAFQAIVNSVVNDLIMPIISLATKGIDFSNKFIVLSKLPEGTAAPATLAAAQEQGLATLSYGSFVSAVINFLIMAIIIFLMVKGLNRLASVGKKPEAPAAPTTKICPFCKSEISIEATRCPHCTSELSEETANA